MDDLEFHDDGTVSVRPDPATPDVVRLRRPRLREYRDLCAAMDEANRAVQTWMRTDVPEDAIGDALELAESEVIGRKRTRVVEDSVRQRTAAYATVLHQRNFLESDANLFPAVWVQVLAVLGEHEIPVDAVQAWMQEPEALAALKNHWTTVPLSRGPSAASDDGQPQQQTTTGNGAA